MEDELLPMMKEPMMVEDILVIMVATTMVPMAMAATMVIVDLKDMVTMEEAKPTVAEATSVVAVAALVIAVMAVTTMDEDLVSSNGMDIKAMVVAMVIKAVAMAVIISKAEETTTTTMAVVPTTTTTTMADSNSKAMEVVSSTMTVILINLLSSSSNNKTNIGLILEMTMDTLIKVTIKWIMTPTVLTFLTRAVLFDLDLFYSLPVIVPSANGRVEPVPSLTPMVRNDKTIESIH